MKTTERFDNAVVKLYNAFHNGELNANSCSACAVGNICGDSEVWYMNSTELIKKGIITKFDADLFSYPKSKEYNRKELFEIELSFLEPWRKLKSDDWFDKNIQFKGLCAVIEYLCKLDGIPNVMDYTKLFETENNQPKYQL